MFFVSSSSRQIHECLDWMESVWRALNPTTMMEQHRPNTDGDGEKHNADDEGDAARKPSIDSLCQLQLQGDALSAAVAYVGTHTEGEEPERETLPTTVLEAALVHCSRRLMRTISGAKEIEARLLRMLK